MAAVVVDDCSWVVDECSCVTLSPELNPNPKFETLSVAPAQRCAST